MKLEEQKLVLIDGKSILQVWTDLKTGEERYEVHGQTAVNVKTPQGMTQAQVPFKFIIEAEDIHSACVQLEERIQEEADRAVREFIGKINAQQQKIQVAREDQVIQIRKDLMRRNGNL